MLKQLSISDIKLDILLQQEQLDAFNQLNLLVQKVHIISFGRYSLKNLFFLKSYISKCDYFFSPALSIPPIFSKSKYIITVHDLCPVRLWKIFGVSYSLTYWFLLFWQLIVANKVIAISNFTKGEISNFYLSLFNKKVVVMHNGLSKRFSAHYETEKKYVKREPFILCVGNIKPHKNIIPFIEFFIKRSKYSQVYKLVVVGQKDGFITRVESELVNSPQVIFKGKISDEELSDLYSTASVFVFPSLYEGFGLPLLEAMSFNLPILASDIPVFNELVGNKVNYFDPLVFDDFDDAFKKSIRMNHSLGYDEILKKFSWENTYEKFNELVLS